MIIKKTLALLIASTISTAASASGCLSLANTTWSAKLNLENQVTVNAPVHITKVVPVGDGLFTLKGDIGNENFLSDSYGCVEQLPGQIRSLLINTKSTQLASHTPSPDRKNPTLFENVTGTFASKDVIETLTSSKSFIIRR
jgi:hypothetical protein